MKTVIAIDPVCISFVLPFEAIPVQFGGKRMVIRGGKPMFFKDKRTKSYNERIALVANLHAPREPWDCPIFLTVLFVMERPTTLRRKRDPDCLMPAPKRPDLDNLLKGLLDPLTACGFWKDDSQITDQALRKRYAEKSGEARIEIMMQKLDQFLP